MVRVNCHIHSSESDGERISVKMYLAEICKMVEFGIIDCVAHLDIFRKRLKNEGILCEKWYSELILGLLDLMKEKGASLEVNCSGWVVLDEQFPQKWIVEEAVLRGIGISIGNDFHKLKFGRLDERIDKVVKMLKSVGCEEVLVFRERVGEKLRI